MDFQESFLYDVYFRKMREDYDRLVDRADANEEGVDAEQNYNFFCMGNLYQLVSKATRAEDSQADMLNEIMNSCEMNFGYSGEEIVKSMTVSGATREENELGYWIHRMTDLNGEQTNFWQMLILLALKCDGLDDVNTILEDCMNFMVGVDRTFAMKYPMCEFGNIARPYMMRCVEQINQDVQKMLQFKQMAQGDGGTLDRFSFVFGAFLQKLDVIMSSEEFEEKYPDMRILVQGLFLYEILMAVDNLTAGEEEKVQAFTKMARRFEFAMEEDSEFEELYHTIRDKDSDWKNILPYVAVQSDQGKVGSFWMMILAAEKEKIVEPQYVTDMLGLHSQYVLEFGVEAREKYGLPKEYADQLMDYIGNTSINVVEYCKNGQKE